MATITNRGPRQWRVRVRMKGQSLISKTFETKAEAERWARQIESDVDKGQYVSTKEAESYTLKECLDRYVEEYVPRLKSPYHEVKRIRHIQKYEIASKIMATIRSKDVAEYRKQREAEGKSGNTIRLDFAILSRLFSYARSDWGMESLQNPVQLASKPKPSRGRERRLEKGEEAKLLSAASASLRPVICFALSTAMRREEISGLRWKNIDLKRRSLLLLDTKNGESRTIPLSPVAIEILKGLGKMKPDSLVFGMAADTISHHMAKACQEAQLENLRFHDLRHEAISRLFETTDLDVMEIKAISGHRTLQMLARYTHLRTARLADRLAGAKRGQKQMD